MMNRALAGACVVWLLAGCTSPGYREGDSASAAMKAAAIESTTARDQIDAAWKELDALLTADKGNLRPAFDRFATAVDGLKTSVDALHTRTERMSNAAGSYLARWDRELRTVKDEDLRQKSAARKAEVEQSVTKAKGLAAQVKSQAVTVQAEFADIRRILGTDLTLAGIETVKHAASRAKASCKSLRETSEELTATLDKISQDIASPVDEPKPEPTK